MLQVLNFEWWVFRCVPVLLADGGKWIWDRFKEDAEPNNAGIMSHRMEHMLMEKSTLELSFRFSLEPIKTAADYEKALSVVDEIFNAEEGTPEAHLRGEVCKRISDYKGALCPIEPCSDSP